MRRRFLSEGFADEDDGLVMIRGHLVPPWFAEANAEHHMDGFDELPKFLRDKINYAPSPETGALPTCDLLRPGGPYEKDIRALARIHDLARVLTDEEV